MAVDAVADAEALLIAAIRRGPNLRDSLDIVLCAREDVFDGHRGRIPVAPAVRMPRAARPRRRRRQVSRTTSSRGDPDPEPEQPPVAHLRGFGPASERMVRHIGRRLGARAA